DPGSPVGLTLVYDGDGNRVSKTSNLGRVQYLVDDNSPTGFAQVVDEISSGGVSRVDTSGGMLIGEDQLFNNNWVASEYGLDGNGSVRLLLDATGAITDTNDYDAFGIRIHNSGLTPNNYLYCGEQFDPDLGLYYLRARYLNTATGRFLTADPLEGV